MKRKNETMRFLVRVEVGGIVPKKEFANSIGAEAGSFSTLGCFTTRLVIANNEKEAVNLAINLVEEELRRDVQEKDTPALISLSVDGIKSLSAGEIPDTPLQGFTFFLE